MHSKITSDNSLKLGMLLTILVFIASAMFVMFVLHAESDDSTAQLIKSGQCGPNAIFSISSDGTLVFTGSGEMDQYDTTHAPWYEDRYDISKIVIGDNITNLGAFAFLDCKFVTELTLPITLNSVVSDKSSAFAGCCNLEKVKFTCGNGGYGYNYAAYPVSDSWYQNTPWYQSRATLKEINFANDIKGIGSDALRELNITSIVLPDSVVHLGNHCFFNCTKLTDLTIPISLNPYGSDDTYPAFKGCTAVQNVTFTKGNKVPFDYWTFWHSKYNTNLAPWNMNYDVAKTIVIVDDVPGLGDFMFSGCNIKELTIPISIDLYGGSTAHKPFDRDDSDITYPNLEKVTITKGTGKGVDYDPYSSSYCPWNTSVNISSFDESSKVMSVIVEEGVTHIGIFTFFRCYMKDLSLPSTLFSFGECAIFECTIKNLTIPISLNATWLDEIPTGFHKTHPAFIKVSGIEKIDFTPGSGYGFDYASYKGCNRLYQHTPWYQSRDTLKEINFAEGITHLGSDAFRELHLTSLVIPNSVKSLGFHTFYNMAELSSLTIPITLDCTYYYSTVNPISPDSDTHDSADLYKYSAFEGVNDLKELKFTAGTNGMGSDYIDHPPFWNYSCNKGITITFDSGIKYIGTDTLSAYQFVDINDQSLEPTAVNLSGHRFQGAFSHLLYRIIDLPEQPSKDSANCYTPVVDISNLHSIEKLNSVVNFDLSKNFVTGICVMNWSAKNISKG